MDGLGQKKIWPFLSYIHFHYGGVLCKIRWEGPFMNIEQLIARLNRLLEKLKEDLPREERIALVDEIKELFSVFL